jgi:hypothetical protein
MFPVKAIKVIAIMRIDHCRGSEVSRLSNSRNVFGAISKNSALSPKTDEPNFRIVRRRLIVSGDV